MTHLDVEDPKPWTAGDATSIEMTIARATCPRCGKTDQENRLCTSEINPLDKRAIEEAVAKCVNRRKAA